MTLDRLMRQRLAAALIYLLAMSRPEGLAANTEVFINLLVIGPAAIALHEMLRRPRALHYGPWFSAAILFGLALQIKYVAFPEATTLR